MNFAFYQHKKKKKKKTSLFLANTKKRTLIFSFLVMLISVLRAMVNNIF